jgi:tRNA pseudouridine38-40 synthase
MRYRATVAYDGTAYKGFQRQANTPDTVQEVLELALARIGASSPCVLGAGRTDAGVHAIGQVIAFDLAWSHPIEALGRALNANLPADVVICDVQETDERFHPRYEAVSRKYVYTIYIAKTSNPFRRLYVWQHAQPLNIVEMQKASASLVGSHDFASFGSPPVGTNTVRVVSEAHWTETGDELRFTIRANSFLYRMVRSIVGTLAFVGQGRMTVSDFEGILAACNRRLAGPSAPPQGLALVEVQYAD